MDSWLRFTPRQLRALGLNLLLSVRLAFNWAPSLCWCLATQTAHHRPGARHGRRDRPRGSDAKPVRSPPRPPRRWRGCAAARKAGAGKEVVASSSLLSSCAILSQACYGSRKRLRPAARKVVASRDLAPPHSAFAERRGGRTQHLSDVCPTSSASAISRILQTRARGWISPFLPPTW